MDRFSVVPELESELEAVPASPAALVTRRLNRKLKVSGIVPCLYETGTRLAGDVTEDLSLFLSQSESQSPWAGANVFQGTIEWG